MLGKTLCHVCNKYHEDNIDMKIYKEKIDGKIMNIVKQYHYCGKEEWQNVDDMEFNKRLKDFLRNSNQYKHKSKNVNKVNKEDVDNINKGEKDDKTRSN